MWSLPTTWLPVDVAILGAACVWELVNRNRRGDSVKKLVLFVLVVAAMVMGGWSWNPPDSAKAGTNVCAPGQHGNPTPAFKPGSCDKP